MCVKDLEQCLSIVKVQNMLMLLVIVAKFWPDYTDSDCKFKDLDFISSNELLKFFEEGNNMIPFYKKKS